MTGVAYLGCSCCILDGCCARRLARKAGTGRCACHYRVSIYSYFCDTQAKEQLKHNARRKIRRFSATRTCQFCVHPYFPCLNLQITINYVNECWPWVRLHTPCPPLSTAAVRVDHSGSYSPSSTGYSPMSCRVLRPHRSREGTENRREIIMILSFQTLDLSNYWLHEVKAFTF